MLWTWGGGRGGGLSAPLHARHTPSFPRPPVTAAGAASYGGGPGAAQGSSLPFLLTGGSDRYVRCWDMGNPEGSYTLCGTEAGYARDE